MDGSMKMDCWGPFEALTTFKDETARRANEEFVRTLATLHENYQNIWKKYLDLLETQKESTEQTTVIEKEADGKNDICVNRVTDSNRIAKGTANLKIIEPISKDNSKEDFDASVDLFSSSNMNSNMKTHAKSCDIETPEISSCDFKSDVEDIPFDDAEEENKKSPLTNFVTSPVFKSKQSSARKKQQLNKTRKKLLQSSLNETVDKEELGKPLKSIENSTRNYSILGISTACNVKTEFLPNGRKCKQSKLVFKPMKSKPNQSFYDDRNESRKIDAEETFFNESRKIEAEKSIFNESRKIDAEKSLFNESRRDSDETNINFVDVSPQNIRKKAKIMKRKTKNEKSSNWTARDMSKASNSKENSAKDTGSPSKKSSMESSVDDATFFAEAETKAMTESEKKKESSDSETQDLDAGVFQKERKRKSPVARVLEDSFDIIPEKKKKSPEFAYKGKTVRNKIERAKLTGWKCWECEQYYKSLGLSEEEMQKRMNQCSRHRAKYNEHPESPEGYWNPVFPQTLGSSAYFGD